MGDFRAIPADFARHSRFSPPSFPPLTPSFPRKRESRRRTPLSPPAPSARFSRRRSGFLTPSFPRKRESRRRTPLSPPTRDMSTFPSGRCPPGARASRPHSRAWARFFLGFQVARLSAIIWIPAFAGMTGLGQGKGDLSGAIHSWVSGGGLVRNHLDSRFRGNDGGWSGERGFVGRDSFLGFAWRACPQSSGFPLSRE